MLGSINSYLGGMQCIYLAILTKVENFVHLGWLWCSYPNLTRRWLGCIPSRIELVGQILSSLSDIRLLVNQVMLQFGSIQSIPSRHNLSTHRVLLRIDLVLSQACAGRRSILSKIVS